MHSSIDISRRPSIIAISLQPWLAAPPSSTSRHLGGLPAGAGASDHIEELAWFRWPTETTFICHLLQHLLEYLQA